MAADEMGAARPLVSVIVPAFNEPPEILEDSLASVMAQTFSDFECLVIDESTKPESIAACAAICARDIRFRHVRPDKRLGLAASLNLGIDMACGSLIARFDSDDVCMPDRLAIQAAFMHANLEVDVLGGAMEIMDESGNTLAHRDYPLKHTQIEKHFHTTTPIAHPTVMMRKGIVQQNSGYDPDFRFAEDLDLWLRLLNGGARFANVRSVLVRYRQQNTQRNARHWQFNLRARRRNFALRHLPQRLFGICAIAAWSRIPDGIQQAIFAKLLLRKHKPVVGTNTR